MTESRDSAPTVVAAFCPGSQLCFHLLNSPLRLALSIERSVQVLGLQLPIHLLKWNIFCPWCSNKSMKLSRISLTVIPCLSLHQSSWADYKIERLVYLIKCSPWVCKDGMWWGPFPQDELELSRERKWGTFTRMFLPQTLSKLFTRDEHSLPVLREE